VALIAVLLPTHKPKDYLERCFKSLDAQTLPKNKFCIYIALNGPREEYEIYIHAILYEFNFHYKYIYLNKPSVSHARNHLIEISSEPYITFMDDDDVVSSNYLESLLEQADEKFIAISNVCNFTENIENLTPNYMGLAFNRLSNKEISKLKIRKFFSSSCGKLIHRNIIGTTRFDTKLTAGEDSLFMTELSHRVVGVKKTDSSACYYVYERPGSTTRSKVNKWREIKRINYLLWKYSFMMFGRQDKLFVLSRIAATMKHVKRLF